MRIANLIAAAAALTLAAGASQAGTLITSDAGYTGPDLNLTGYDNGSYNFTFGPMAVGEFTFTAAPGGGGNSGLGSVVGQGGYGLGANGNFGGDAVYIGVGLWHWVCTTVGCNWLQAARFLLQLLSQ